MKVKKALKIFGKVDGVVVGIILLVCIVLISITISGCTQRLR